MAIIAMFDGKQVIGPPGKSAYEIAVDNGFTGTEAEWLESLKGPQGETGEQGPPGESTSMENNYSLEEQRIGTWIDGKPIYRKYIDGKAPSTFNTWTQTLNGDNYDTIIKYYGSITESNTNNVSIPGPWIGISVLNNDIGILIGATSLLSQPFRIFVEYTKTTD